MPSNLLPLASHLTAEEAADLVRRANERDAQQKFVNPNPPRIGPLDPRTTPVPATREDPFAGKELLQSWAEDALDPANWGAPGGGALEAVAVGGPAMIKPLKARAAKMVEDIAAHGLPQRIMNETQRDLIRMPASDEINDALDFAMKRYPRLMGHQLNIGEIDEASKRAQGGQFLRGQSSAVSPRTVLEEAPEIVGDPASTGAAAQDVLRKSRLLSDKMSAIGLHPRKADANTIGHELLHSADRLTMPDFDRSYQFAQTLPGVQTRVAGVGPMAGKSIRIEMSPYEASSAEVRARNMGERFERDFHQFWNTDPNLPYAARLKQVKAIYRPAKPAPTKAQMKTLRDPWKLVKPSGK